MGRQHPPRGRYFGAIDCGSSSAKMVITNARGRVVLDIKQGTKLGAKVGRDRLLPAANQQRARAALKRFVKVAGSYGIAPSQLELIATAAVRNATGRAGAKARAEGKRSGSQFIDAVVKGELGIKNARILSGEQEAKIGYRGALASWSLASISRELGRSVKRVTVVDTGGSSNQATTMVGKKIVAGSIQIGSHRVRGLMEQGQPGKQTYTAAELTAADSKLARQMTRLGIRHRHVLGSALVVTGGFGKFLRAHFGRDRVTRGDIERLRAELSAMPHDKRGLFVRKQRGSNQRLDKTQLEALGITKLAAAREYGEALPHKATLLLRVLKLAGVANPTDAVLLSASDARHALINNAQQK